MFDFCFFLNLEIQVGQKERGRQKFKNEKKIKCDEKDISNH